MTSFVDFVNQRDKRIKKLLILAKVLSTAHCKARNKDHIHYRLLLFLISRVVFVTVSLYLREGE